jgi:hypothetical protein
VTQAVRASRPAVVSSYVTRSGRRPPRLGSSAVTRPAAASRWTTSYSDATRTPGSRSCARSVMRWRIAYGCSDCSASRPSTTMESGLRSFRGGMNAILAFKYLRSNIYVQLIARPVHRPRGLRRTGRSPRKAPRDPWQPPRHVEAAGDRQDPRRGRNRSRAPIRCVLWPTASPAVLNEVQGHARISAGLAVFAPGARTVTEMPEQPFPGARSDHRGQ